MRLTVFGANGATGRLLVRQALGAGHHLTAVTRHPGSFPLRDRRLSVTPGDAHDAAAVARAVEGADAVLSALGVPFTFKPVSIYSDGARNIIAAMHQHGVKRLAVVSSSATCPAQHSDGGLLLNHVVQPLIIATIGKTTYSDMRVMEELVRGSGLAWTILRPSGLFDAPRVTNYQLHNEHAPGLFTSRADLAASLLEQAASTELAGKAVAVTTSEGAPTLFQMLRREAFKRR
jgi:putative NADH-flavin reductase